MSRHALLLTGLLVTWPAMAGSLYLNGVKIDGVTNQKFEKVTVRIDEVGNVFLDAPGYSVRQVEGAPDAVAAAMAAVTTGATVSRKYFLVTEQTAPGMTEYDIDVYLNSKWLRRLRSTDEQIITEITRQLQPGKNTVMFIAKKTMGGTRKSFSKEHVFRVIIGEGGVSGDHVMIDNPLVKFERTAADSADLTQEFQLTTR